MLDILDNNKTRRKQWGGIVGLLKTVIVFFVFVNILYVTDVNPIGGIIDLVNSFVDGGLAGLLALIVFATFLD